jgi:EmrB/QacA subfamily drug resistance transporter
MTLLDVTIVNVAIPSIQAGLEASEQSVQWVVSGYALTFGLTLVAGGRMGDVVGRRRMFLIGLAGFTVTSALCGAAWSGPALVVARLLQGVSAGLLTPQNTGLIQQLFDGRDRARAFGIFGTTVGVSSAAGPLIGGALISGFGAEDGWRWVFYVNIPIGLAAMVLAVRLLPTAASGGVRAVVRQLDGLGAVLLGIAVLALLLPIVEAQAEPATRWWWVLPVAPAAAWLFVRRERGLLRRQLPPLLDVRLFSQAPGYAGGLLLATVYFCGFAGVWLVLALLFQDGLGYSALESGLAVLPFAVGSSLTSLLAGRMLDRYGHGVLITGLVGLITGFLALAVLLALGVPDHLALWTALPLFVAGLGSGATISPNFTLTLASVPREMGGAAGGAIQTGQRIGAAVGAAVLATIYRVTLDGRGLGTAGAVTFVASAGFAALALVVAVRERTASVRR